MKQSSFIVMLLSAKKYFYVLSFSLAMFLGSGFVYGQNSNSQNSSSNNNSAIIPADSLAKMNAKAKQKNVPDSLKKGQKVFKPERPSTNNGDNNPKKKPE